MSEEKYTVGELAKKLQLTPRTIRYYDQKGLVQPAFIEENGYRIYTEKEVEKFEFVLYLKGLGFSLKHIRQLLSDENSELTLNALLEKQILDNQAKLAQLQDKQKKLHNLRKFLNKNSSEKDVSDIKEKMEAQAELKHIHKKFWILGLLLDVFELLIIAGIFVTDHAGQKIMSLWILIVGLIIILVSAAMLTAKYYQEVAYICPNCQTKFVPQFKQFFFAAHTPKLRKLTCPNCHKKSYCLETSR